MLFDTIHSLASAWPFAVVVVACVLVVALVLSIRHHEVRNLARHCPFSLVNKFLTEQRIER